ncbi:hypothetical protein B296_00059254 [Ensete ventricosum]|uniref:Uncharacterized protein n=1 Tax=Ensete ventricosum TaxID=4639 RepID=A0A426XIL7_ENSVE|nr:hypothetical protein B296_00059254 [Ensete ventricosum]
MSYHTSVPISCRYRAVSSISTHGTLRYQAVPSISILYRTETNEERKKEKRVERFFMRRYSSPYYSPPRRGYGGRGRSPPRRGYGGYGGKERGSGSLLVRNIPLNCR